MDNSNSYIDNKFWNVLKLIYVSVRTMGSLDWFDYEQLKYKLFSSL